jgi:hypothetical protein
VVEGRSHRALAIAFIVRLKAVAAIVEEGTILRKE